MPKYRTREIVVEARQVTGEENIDVPGGSVEVDEGDWVITTEEGVSYPIMFDSAFQALFKPCDEKEKNAKNPKPESREE